MPEWLLIALALVVVAAFCFYVALGLTGMNTKAMRRDSMPFAARFAEGALTVNDFASRPEALAADDREIRCLRPLHDMTRAEACAAADRGEIETRRLPRKREVA